VRSAASGSYHTCRRTWQRPRARRLRSLAAARRRAAAGDRRRDGLQPSRPTWDRRPTIANTSRHHLLFRHRRFHSRIAAFLHAARSAMANARARALSAGVDPRQLAGATSTSTCLRRTRGALCPPLTSVRGGAPRRRRPPSLRLPLLATPPVNALAHSYRGNPRRAHLIRPPREGIGHSYGPRRARAAPGLLYGARAAARLCRAPPPRPCRRCDW